MPDRTLHDYSPVLPCAVYKSSSAGFIMTLPLYRRWDNAVSSAVQSSFGPRQAKTCLRAYAGSEGLDQTARPRSLI